jgi:hypothetical protein
MAHAATATGSATTLVVRPLTLTNIDPLSFGNLIAGPTAGTASVSILGVRTVTGGVTAAGGAVSAARFAGLDISSPYTVILHAPTPATVTLTRVGGGATMTVTNLIVESGPGTYTAPTNVPFQVRVGGQLNVAANQTQGTYAGTFSLTIDYP